MVHKRWGLQGWWYFLWGAVFLLSWKLLPSTVHAYRLWWQTRQETQALLTEKTLLTEELATLRTQIQRLSTPLGKETLARERGWIMPDEYPLQIQLDE